MDLAYFTMPLHPETRPFAETLREDREAFLLADELGFTEAYMGEHVTDTFEPIPNSMMFLASIAYETKNIKLGTGTVNLGHHHPAATAAEAAMLDHMLEGRFLFGVSPGNLPSDAEVFGTLEANRNEMFVEALEHIIAIWTEDPPYRLTGKYWNITTENTLVPEIGAGIIGTPYQKPHPPIIGTVVAPYSKGIVGLGERGWYAISANFLQPKWVATHWPLFEEGAGRSAAMPTARTGAWRRACLSPTTTRSRRNTARVSNRPIVSTSSNWAPNCGAPACSVCLKRTGTSPTRSSRSITWSIRWS